MHWNNALQKMIALNEHYLSNCMRELTETGEKAFMAKRKAHHFSDHNELKYPNGIWQNSHMYMHVCTNHSLPHLYISRHVPENGLGFYNKNEFFLSYFAKNDGVSCPRFHLLSHLTIQTHHWLNKSIMLRCGMKQLNSPIHVCAMCIKIRWNEKNDGFFSRRHVLGKSHFLLD